MTGDESQEPQRAFFEQVNAAAGYVLDWQDLDAERNRTSRALEAVDDLG